jgi:hypothetical protein
MSRHPTFCKHYRAMFEHSTCEAGVAYDTFKGMDFKARPCFRDNTEKPRPGCELAAWQTPEEIAEYERWLNERIANIGKARLAIVDHLGGPWKKGTAGGAGKIKCPCCESGELQFSRAGYNGHIHARCSTDKCVSWME